jgi:hypothetical protein
MKIVFIAIIMTFFFAAAALYGIIKGCYLIIILYIFHCAAGMTTGIRYHIISELLSLD